MKLCIASWLFALMTLAPACYARDGRYAQQNYIHFCAGCHQFDGAGSAENGIPDMRGRIGKFLYLPQGRTFLIQVPGVANSPLTDTEVAEVLDWLIKTFSPAAVPENAPAFTEEEVARLRAQRPSDVSRLRADVVEQLRQLGHVIN